jgi:hypothetical protein
MTVKMITPALLKRLMACESEQRRFRYNWPNGCKLSPKNCETAMSIDLNVLWLFSNLMPENKQTAWLRGKSRIWHKWLHSPSMSNLERDTAEIKLFFKLYYQ